MLLFFILLGSLIAGRARFRSRAGEHNVDRGEFSYITMNYNSQQAME